MTDARDTARAQQITKHHYDGPRQIRRTRAELTDAIQQALAEVRAEPVTRFAWLLERDVDGQPAYWDGNHAESFTRHVEHAIQFSRQHDAYRSQRALLVPNRWGWKTVEHGFIATVIAQPAPERREL